MADEGVMRAHPVPGTIVKEWVIPAREYAAFTMRRHQTLRFVDIEGKQVPDLVCFNEHDLTEHLNMGNSLLLNKRRELRRGDVLYSVVCNRMMTITGYSNEESYAYGPMCSEELNRIRYGVSGTRNCRDNFAMALAPYGFDRRQIPNAFVPFMRVEVGPDGLMEIREPTSRAGDFYDLRAEMDLLVAVSNCPQERNPCNGFNPTPMGIVIYEGA
ncbi:MAG TPA: urea carboxylase-associated family protein [Candidatus Eisenbacteria bacterium]|nr:urea carboxylase-associated family protein [Candidatus Eisenbacteria bacterium]